MSVLYGGSYMQALLSVCYIFSLFMCQVIFVQNGFESYRRVIIFL